MPVYAIIEIKILDEGPYIEYVKNVRSIVEHYNGHYLVRGGKITQLFGDLNPERIIVIEFPSREGLTNCLAPMNTKRLRRSENDPRSRNQSLSRTVLWNNNYDCREEGGRPPSMGLEPGMPAPSLS